MGVETDERQEVNQAELGDWFALGREGEGPRLVLGF